MDPENTVEGTYADKWQRMAALAPQSASTSVNLNSRFNQLVWRRLLLRNSLVFFLQYTGLMFSTVSNHFATSWFASGTACAFIFLRGYTVVPGLWLGSIAAYHVAGLDFNRASICALILTLQAFFLVKLNYRSSILAPIFFQRSYFLKFLGYCALTTASGSFLLVCCCFTALPHSAPFGQIYLEWWLANFNGTVILSCALAAWDAYFPDLRKLKTIRKTKFIIAFIGLIFFSGALWVSKTLLDQLLFSLLLGFLIMEWGLTFRWCGVTAATFILAFLLNCAAIFKIPPLATQQSYFKLYLASFLCVCTIFAMMAVVGEENR